MSNTTKLMIAAGPILAVEVTVMAIFVSLWIVPLAVVCVLMILAASLEWRPR